VQNLRSGIASPVERGTVTAQLHAKLADDGRARLFESELLQIEASGASVRGGLEKARDVAARLYAEVGLQGGLVALRLAGDSFLGRYLPARPVELQVDAAAGWSLDRGFYLRGRAVATIAVPVHTVIGPLTIEMLHLGVGVGADDIRVETAVSASLDIGPCSVTAERFGSNLRLGEDGNLGALDVEVEVQAPAGLGLAIDAGPVNGGGYLAHDLTSGRYVGALELQVFDIGIKALGLLDTRLPGGVPAYSFVAMIAAELPPVPLGFGFTLKGVGGLLGVHRSADVEQLRRLLREGRLDDLLFAESPVADGPRIAADLASAFPPAAAR
jgi:hypothetical protein